MANESITLEQKDLNTQLNIVGLSEFLALELPPREPILAPWLYVGGLCQLHAFRGIGKTHMSLGIAYAAATGSDFLNWKAPKACGVLYIDGEMPARSLQERLAQIVIMSGNSHINGKLNLLTPDLQDYGIPDLATPEGQAIINQYITDEIDLIILDNLSCLVRSGKENDATDWMPVQSWILGLRAKGKSVLLIHHSGKSGTQRGCSKREDVLDTVIGLERPKDYEQSQGARFIVRFEKARNFFGDDAQPFEAHLCDDGTGKTQWKTMPLEETNYQKIISLKNDGLNQTEIADELGINKSTVSRHIKKAKEDGLIKESNHDK